MIGCKSYKEALCKITKPERKSY